MLRKILIASVAIAGLTGTALAADLPTTKGPPVYAPPPPPVFTWTGFYIGGQAGYQWGRTNTTELDPTGAFIAALPGYTDDGFVGGAHAGYNYQINQFVLGVEGDVEGSTFQGSTAGGGFSYLSTRIPLQGSFRGRIGYSWDRALLYATGGVAIADIHNDFASGAPPFAPGAFDSFWTGQVGWTAGGGVEYAIDPNWSVRAEYRYTDFGHYYLRPIDLAGDVGRVRLYDNAVRVGFSYKFDWAMPVVSKY